MAFKLPYLLLGWLWHEYQFPPKSLSSDIAIVYTVFLYFTRLISWLISRKIKIIWAMTSPDVTRKLAKKLKQLREKRGLTQEEVAELADLSTRHYQQLESDRNLNAPQLDTLEKLARALKVKLTDLVDF